MADAALAAHEQHADIGQIDERHAIVTGSAREFAHRQSLRGNRLADLFHQPRRAGGRLAFVRGVDFQRDLATRADRLHRLLDVRYRGEPLGIARRADVEGEEYLARNDVGRPGKRFELANSTHQIRNADTTPLDRQHAFSGGGKRILAQIHRHCAGMAGHAVDFDQKAIGTIDGSHDPDREAFRLQHRALFDVQFCVRQHVVTLVRGA